MEPIKVKAILEDLVLVTRDSAHPLRREIGDHLPARKPLELDFEGIAGMTPSFFDELLTLIEDVGDYSPDEEVHVIIHNPPTQVSSKFEAVARGHHLSLQEHASRRWLLEPVIPTAS